MSYIEVETGVRHATLDSVRRARPNISFPAGQADFSAWGFEPVLETDPPAANAVTERVQEAPAQLNADGAWESQWLVVSKFTEFTDDDGVLQTIAMQEAAALSEYAAKTATAKLDDIERVIQQHLDAQAKTMGYDSIHTGVTYADEPAVPKFQADGVALRAWRSNVWAAVYTLLAEYEAGTRAEMTPEEVVALLPAYVG